MAEQLNDRESSGLADKLMQYLPARFRPGTAVVPVVRLSGVIGAVTPLHLGRAQGDARPVSSGKPG